MLSLFVLETIIYSPALLIFYYLCLWRSDVLYAVIDGTLGRSFMQKIPKSTRLWMSY